MQTKTKVPQKSPKKVNAREQALFIKRLKNIVAFVGEAKNIGCKLTSGGLGSTDFRNIYIRKGDFSDPDYVNFSLGLAYHEAGHIAFTSRNQSFSLIPDFAFSILNAIEDVRMETCVKDKFKGARKYITYIVNYFAQSKISSDEAKNLTNSSILHNFVLMHTRAYHNNDVALLFIAKMYADELAQRTSKDLVDAAKLVLAKVESAASTEDCLIIAKEVLKLFGMDLDKPKDDSDSDSDDDTDDTSDADSTDDTDDNSEADSNDDADDNSDSDSTDDTDDTSDADSTDDTDDNSEADSTDDTDDTSEADSNDDADDTSDADSNDDADDTSEADSNDADDNSEADSTDDADDNSDSDSTDDTDDTSDADSTDDTDDNSEADSNDDTDDTSEADSNDADDNSDADSNDDADDNSEADSTDDTDDTSDADSNDDTDDTSDDDSTDDIKDFLNDEDMDEEQPDFHELIKEVVNQMADDSKETDPLDITSNLLSDLTAISDSSVRREDGFVDKEMARRNTNKLKLSFRKILLGIARAQDAFFKTGARLSSSRLTDIISDPLHAKPFTERYRSPTPTAGVVIVVDASGSMSSNHRFIKANTAALAVANALDGLPHVDAEVRHMYQDSVVLTKPFGQKCVPERFGTCVAGFTPTALVVGSAITSLMSVPKDKRMIIVITDGAADCVDSLESMVDQATMLGIQVKAIGINVNDVPGIPNHCLIDDVDDLSSKLEQAAKAGLF